MKIGPGLVVPALAELVILGLFTADVLGETVWPDGFVVIGRVIVVVAAVVVAGYCYHAWSVAVPDERTTLVHTAAGAGLVGGAALASAVTSAGENELFGSTLISTLGVVCVVAAVVCHQVAVAQRTAPQ